MQFENAAYRSPINSQPAYENNQDNFDVNQIMSRFRSHQTSPNGYAPNGYVNTAEIPNMKHMVSNQQDSDHFGYLSSIPQVDISANENLYGSDRQPFENSHPNEDIYRQAGTFILPSLFGFCWVQSFRKIHWFIFYLFFFFNLDLNSQDQLMVLYSTRMQEVSNLTKELSTLRHERDTEVEQLKRKLLLLEAEKQGAFLSHKEAQSLLSESFL